jgi:hypothetical protein
MRRRLLADWEKHWLIQMSECLTDNPRRRSYFAGYLLDGAKKTAASWGVVPYTVYTSIHRMLRKIELRSQQDFWVPSGPSLWPAFPYKPKKVLKPETLAKIKATYQENRRRWLESKEDWIVKLRDLEKRHG